MILPPLDLQNGALVISPSGLDLLKSCMRHWGYKYLHLRERNTPMAARTAGKALHAALQARYQTARSAAPDEAAIEAMNAALAAEFSKAGEMPLDEWRSEARYREVVRFYNEHYGAENFEVLACELPLGVPLGVIRGPEGELPVLLKGIIDRLVRFPDNTHWVMDTKTMSQWKESQQSFWQAAAAPKAYAWGVQELARLEPELGLPATVTGFYLEAVVVRKPFAESTLAKAAKSEAYAAKLEPRTEFKRLPFFYNQATLTEWRQNTLTWLQIMVDAHAAGALPFNERHCASWYGGSCPFWDVCSVPEEQRALVLGSDLYRSYERSPFDGAGEEGE